MAFGTGPDEEDEKEADVKTEREGCGEEKETERGSLAKHRKFVYNLRFFFFVKQQQDKQKKKKQETKTIASPFLGESKRKNAPPLAPPCSHCFVAKYVI